MWWCSGQLLLVRGAGEPGLPCPAGITAQPQSPELAPGLLCAGIVSETGFPDPSLPAPCLQGGWGGGFNCVQIMKPESYSCIIPHLRQMRFITVLGGVSKMSGWREHSAPRGSCQGWSCRGGSVCSSPDPLLS